MIMTKHWRLGAAALLAWALAGAAGAKAEAVAVNQATGQGFIFTHQGNCYLMLPQHVHGRARTVTLVTASPSVAGDAQVFRSFSPGNDLSIALVGTDMQGRCRDSWKGLPERTDALLDRGGDAVLTRISASGVEEHLPMRITSRDLDFLTASPLSQAHAAEIFKGISGATLRVDGQVVGMAVTSANEAEATFLRIDAIKAVMGRLLDSQPAAPPPPVAAAAAAPAGGQCGATGAVALAALACSLEPASPEFACSNLLQGKPVRFPAGARNVALTVQLAPAAPVPVGAVRLGAQAAEGEATPPRGIRVEVNSGAEGERGWRDFGRADMTPFGQITLQDVNRTQARRLRIWLVSGWDDALPMQLDCLSVE